MKKTTTTNIRVTPSELFLIEELALMTERGNRSALLIKCVEKFAKIEHPDIYEKYLESRDKEIKATNSQPIKRFKQSLEEIKEEQAKENQS